MVQALLREKDREIGALNSQLSQLCSGGEPSKKEAAEFLVRFTHARARARAHSPLLLPPHNNLWTHSRLF